MYRTSNRFPSTPAAPVAIVVDEGKRHETAFAAVLRALHMGKISPEPVQSGSRKSDTVASLLATKAVQQMVQDGSLVELGEVRKHLTLRCV